MADSPADTGRFLKAMDSALVKLERMVSVGELAGGVQGKSLLGKASWEDMLAEMQSAFLSRLDTIKADQANLSTGTGQQFTGGELKQQAFLDLADLMREKLDSIGAKLQISAPQMGQMAEAPDEGMKVLLGRVADAMDKAQATPNPPQPPSSPDDKQATNWTWLRNMFGDLILLVTRIDSRLANFGMGAGGGVVPEADPEKKKRSLGSLRDAGSQLWQAMNEPRLSGMTKNLFGAVGSAAGAIPGGAAASGVAKLGETAFAAIEGLERWTKGLHESNMQLAHFSISMAHVKIEQQFRDLAFYRQQGERRAATAGMLAKSYSDMRETTAPYEDKAKNFLNVLGAVAAEAIKVAIKTVEEKAGLTPEKKKALGLEEYKDTAFTVIDAGEYFKSINQEKWYNENAKKGRRDRERRQP